MRGHPRSSRADRGGGPASAFAWASASAIAPRVPLSTLLHTLVRDPTPSPPPFPPTFVSAFLFISIYFLTSVPLYGGANAPPSSSRSRPKPHSYVPMFRSRPCPSRSTAARFPNGRAPGAPRREPVPARLPAAPAPAVLRPRPGSQPRSLGVIVFVTTLVFVLVLAAWHPASLGFLPQTIKLSIVPPHLSCTPSA